MDTGWRYRLASVGGVAALVGLAVMLANNGTVQAAASAVPVLGRLPVDPPAGAEFVIEVALTAAVVAGAFVPLYKPRPRRILDIVALAHKRTFVAVFALATIGYFDYTYKVPRLTLVLITPLLLLVLPAWFVWLRRPEARSERAIVVGDDLTEISRVTRIAREMDLTLLGYLFPTRTEPPRQGPAGGVDESENIASVADGGIELDDGVEQIGGLSRLEDVLVTHDVDTVILAFGETDRAEFFGALDACYEHGVAAKAHRDTADAVLLAEDDPETLVDIDIEPWDVQDHILKRAFDVAFSGIGLIGLSPIILAIAAAIKLDDGGSILYQQERTAVFGETFDVYKFRSMVEDAESATGVKISDEDEGGIDPRVTRVGRVLRQTHLDEIPQLWAVFSGKMSVVGPRPERPEIDADIQHGVDDWPKRWFVKPGLTGLAQINDVTGKEPDQKIRYDLQYIKRQSFNVDMKIVMRQIWKVLVDAAAIVTGKQE
ncbi:sugar transferase [Halorubrum ezzemoulense]|uniref:sugar transferase n=1 Tax=Halorubrum ezzemoulense TaxID=337243 RepID=UPI00232EB84A|nr:sugar transferase [Halorubrum ezzemoulense]MDB9250067.1 sugar transferase [Halorubrum ezzemoulense]MDB9260235.1 sugar transferase [Halorubrum ezzemoulense]MDB9263530.1 sugar transferase [Halorubrum ezzemoulense]MDB9267209.1 sugar transferase [Halorubrum ezzemoulense]MDB9270596.1 sugar transferase [Halorubrum ezzemoulense]